LSDSSVVLPDDSAFTGKKIDNTQVTVDGIDVQRQRVQLAGSTELDLVEGDATNGLDVDVTRVSGTVTVGDGGSTLSVDDGGATLSIDDGGGTISIDGTITGISSTVNVQGGKSVGGGVASATFVGVLPGQANASAPAWSENTNVPLSTDLNGALRVTGGTGSPSMTDATAFTPASDKVNPIAGYYDADGSSVLSDNNIAAVRISRNRNQHVKLMDGIGDNEFGAEVDSAGRVSIGVKNITSGIKIEAIGDIAHDQALTSANHPLVVGGYASSAVPTSVTADGDAAWLWTSLKGAAKVDIVTPAGDSAMDDTVDAVKITGGVAHDAVDAGNPVKVGGQARQTNPTAVSDADRVNATFDDLGRQVVVLNQVRDLEVHQTTTITNSTAETTVLTAVASTFLDLVSLDITNASATAVVATLKDATSGTTQAVFAIAANGGVTKPYMVPLKQTTVNNNWTITLSVNTVTVYINVQAVKNI